MPETGGDVEAGKSTSEHTAAMHHGSSSVDLVGEEHDVLMKHTGDEHGHGDGHGDGHDHNSVSSAHDDHGHHEKPWPLILNTVLLMLFCMLLATITSIYPYAGSYPSKHWSYEGANGPEWWGTVKPKYAMCLDGDIQSPIDINEGAKEGRSYHYSRNNGTSFIGHNNKKNNPEKVLMFMLDPYYKANESEVYGAAFNPTQNHKSPRFDCGPGKIDGKKGECGHMYWNDGEDLTVENVTKTRYNLQEFHFHSPSEHTIDGKRYPMEMQVVFCTGDCNQDGGMPDKTGKKAKSGDLYSGTQADDSDKFVVYSVLFEAGDPQKDDTIIQETQALGTIWNYITNDCPETRDKFGYDCPRPGDYCDDVTVDESTCPKAPDKFKLKDLIISGSAQAEPTEEDEVYGAQEFYTWMGSITTPPCIEGVRWFLQKQVVKVPMDYLQLFYTHIGGHPGNSRPLQLRNGRNITGYGVNTFA